MYEPSLEDLEFESLAFAIAHPEIEDMRPVWADDTHIDPGEDAMDVTYELEVGIVTARAVLTYRPSEAAPRWAYGTSDPYVVIPFERHATSAELRALAADLLVMAERFDSIGAEK